MNVLLIRAGYPPLILRPEDRPTYHDALMAAQLRDDRAAWHAFLYTQLSATLDRVLQMLNAA